MCYFREGNCRTDFIGNSTIPFYFHIRYSFHNLSCFNVEPAALAPLDTDSAQKYAVSGTLVVRIPYRFAWEELPPIEMSLDVRSQWQAKF